MKTHMRIQIGVFPRAISSVNVVRRSGVREPRVAEGVTSSEEAAATAKKMKAAELRKELEEKVVSVTKTMRKAEMQSLLNDLNAGNEENPAGRDAQVPLLWRGFASMDRCKVGVGVGQDGGNGQDLKAEAMWELFFGSPSIALSAAALIRPIGPVNIARSFSILRRPGKTMSAIRTPNKH